MPSAECGTVSKREAIHFWLIFVILFGAVGLVSSWTLARTLHDLYRAREWVPAHAKVDAFNAPFVEYHYTFGDAQHRGDRLGPLPFSIRRENDRDYDAMAAALERAARSGESITVWVNPANPDESMLQRDLPWSSVAMMVVFTLGFGGAGMGTLFIVARIVASPRERFPKVQEAKSGSMMLWCFALAWNAINIPIAIAAIHDAITVQDYRALGWVAFVPFGMVAVAMAVVVTLDERRERRRSPVVDPIAFGRSDRDIAVSPDLSIQWDEPVRGARENAEDAGTHRAHAEDRQAASGLE